MSEIISLGSGDTLGNSGVNGKVGIGTTSPQKKLHIAGASRAITFDVDDTYPRINMTGESPVINWDSSKNIYFGETNYTGHYLVRGCSVGIGTTSPSEKLEVNGNIKTTGGGVFNGHLVLGNYHLWVDGQGKLRIKSGAPTGDGDGSVVGTQT